MAPPTTMRHRRAAALSRWCLAWTCGKVLLSPIHSFVLTSTDTTATIQHLRQGVVVHLSARSDLGNDESRSDSCSAAIGGDDDDVRLSKLDRLRRRFMERVASSAVSIATAASSSTALMAAPRPASAASPAKSRTDGYSVQRSEREWAYILSGSQYNVLREGGTERPYSSILEGEERAGTYACAGCGTDLFASGEKFHSGTGWPSFASALDGVEVEKVSAVQMSLLGAELRCGTCGGHLGDVFNDGYLFVGTPAFKSGKRYCIDGAALIFKPKDGSGEVIGDTPPPQGKGVGLPSFLEPPKISARER